MTCVGSAIPSPNKRKVCFYEIGVHVRCVSVQGFQMAWEFLAPLTREILTLKIKQYFFINARGTDWYSATNRFSYFRILFCERSTMCTAALSEVYKYPITLRLAYLRDLKVMVRGIFSNVMLSLSMWRRLLEQLECHFIFEFVTFSQNCRSCTRWIWWVQMKTGRELYSSARAVTIRALQSRSPFLDANGDLSAAGQDETIIVWSHLYPHMRKR